MDGDLGERAVTWDAFNAVIHQLALKQEAISPAITRLLIPQHSQDIAGCGNPCVIRANNQSIYRCNCRNYKEFRDIPNFNGFVGVDNFAEWLFNLEEFSNYVKISDEKKVKGATSKLRFSAAKWWDQLQFSRAQQGKLNFIFI